MNKKYIIRLFVILILAFSFQFLIFTKYSNAAVEINKGTTKQMGLTANQEFKACYDMRYPTSSLGNNRLDPHMAKATDWGISTYLGLSSYGTVKSNTGDTIQIDSVTYTSTNGNATGVLDLGTSGGSEIFVRTASYYEGTGSNDNRSLLYAQENSKYVDVLSNTYSVETTRGMAYAETAGWYGESRYANTTNMIGLRQGTVGAHNAAGNNGGWLDGAGTGKAMSGSYANTYRPVIWNSYTN